MPFEKPLRAFVSYCHTDSRLFGEFRAQIKSLEDDGIIKVWHDRKITGGMTWDQTIRRKLDEAHLFIALTSAEFNDSKYIEGVEMKRAEVRHQEGTCRLIPILLRSWKPPKRLTSQYQFLPISDQLRAVASSKIRADVWMKIVGQIQDVADEMLAGQWPEKPAHCLFPDLPYLCDWRQTIADIEKGVKSPTGQRLPCVVILIATRDDCYERFMRRVANRHLSKALGLGELEPDIKTLDRLELFKDEIHNALVDRDRPFEKKDLREGLTVLSATENGDDWTVQKDQLLIDFLRYWGDWDALTGLRGLVSFVCMVVTRKKDFKAKIEGLVQKAQANVPVVVVEVPEIPSDSAASWTELPEVRRLCGSGVELDMRKKIRGFYPNPDEPLPMGVLAPKLLDLVQRYRIEA